jgi:hypothetical protein
MNRGYGAFAAGDPSSYDGHGTFEVGKCMGGFVRPPAR